MKTTVVHIYTDGYDVNIMRPGKWGNPFRIGPDGSREDVVRKHYEWIPTQPHLMADLHELKGKRLGCCCKRRHHFVPCHGDTLAELADAI